MPGTAHRVGTREEWLAARVASARAGRRSSRAAATTSRACGSELPWVPVQEEYRFDTEDGSQDARRALGRSARS